MAVMESLWGRRESGSLLGWVRHMKVWNMLYYFIRSTDCNRELLQISTQKIQSLCFTPTCALSLKATFHNSNLLVRQRKPKLGGTINWFDDGSVA